MPYQKQRVSIVDWLLDRVTRLRDTHPHSRYSAVLRAQTSRRSLAGLGSELRDRLPCFLFVEQVLRALRVCSFIREPKGDGLMTFRRIQISVVGVVLFTFFIALSFASPTGRGATVPNPATTKNSFAPPVANWTFSGCWTQFSSQPCRDIFVDQQGNHYICRACGTTGKPGPGKCNPISAATLASGLWCS